MFSANDILFLVFKSWGQRKEKRAGKKKKKKHQRGGGVGVRASLSFPPHLFLALFLRAAFHYPTAWSRPRLCL